MSDMTGTGDVTGRSGVAVLEHEWFPAQLALGPGHLDADQADRLADRLVAVAQARRIPLHVNVAWNALHFGYDPSTGMYADLFAEGDLPEVQPGQAQPALPVGALCWVQLGGKTVWAEIVGKDGRPPGLDGGFVEAAWSGRAAQVAADGSAALREAWVVDLDAFGAADDQTRRHVRRMIERGRLDRHGLVELDACYETADAANEADRDFYARWLLDARPSLVRYGPLGLALTSPDAQQLHAGVANSLAAVADLLGDCDAFTRWGDTFLLREWVDDLDRSPDLPLHAGDLGSVLASMRHASHAVYIPLEGRLDELAASLLDSPPERRPWDEDDVGADPLHQTAWLKMMYCANRWLADRVALDEPTVVDVRVDDRFAWGGIWRAEQLPATHPLRDVPVDVPLGLGANGLDALAAELGCSRVELDERIRAAMAAHDEQQATPDTPDEPDTPVDEPYAPLPPDDVDLMAVDSFVEATITLNQADLAGELPLDDRFGWLNDLDVVYVRITHDGEIDDDQVLQRTAPVHDEHRRRLAPLSWPVDMFPGIRLHCMALPGTPTLVVATTPLLEPVDGYCFAFDPRAMASKKKVDVPRLGLLASRTIARHGTDVGGHQRTGTAAEVTERLFGPDSDRLMVEVVAAALDREVALGRISKRGDAYLVTRNDMVPRRPPALIAPGASPPGSAARPGQVEIRPHFVVGFLRRLPIGWRASDQKRREYAEAWERRLVPGRSPELPDGYTYVSGHTRGGDARVFYAQAAAGLVDDAGTPVPADEAFSFLFEDEIPGEDPR